MPLTYLPILFAIIASAAHFFSSRIYVHRQKFSKGLMSFSAGMSITYILLEFYPRFTEAAFATSQLLFIPALAGFIIHHLIETEIYQHNKNHQLIKKLSIEENAFSFVYHFILGILLVTFTELHVVEGILYFILVLSFTFVSNLPATPQHSFKKAIFLSSSTLLGTLFAMFIWTSRAFWLETFLMGLVLGILLFTVTRHHIPFGGSDKVSYFSLGFLFYSLLIIATWYLR